MIISKNTSKKNGKTYINVIIDAKSIQDTKNPNYKKFSFPTDWKVGLEDKSSIELGQLIKVELLK